MTPYRYAIPRAEEPPPPRVTRSLQGTALVLYALDVLVTGMPLAAILATAIALLYALGAVHARLSGQRSKAVRRGVRSALFATTTLAVGASIALDIHLADAHGHAAAEALARYRTLHGRCPATLTELVPAQTDRLPGARVALLLGGLQYASSPERHALWWVVVPPFSRAYYLCEEDRWTELD